MLSLTQLFHSHPITFSPFEKDLDSLNQNLYLSPFLSLFFGFLSNSTNSKFSLTLDGGGDDDDDDDDLLGSLDCTCQNP